MAAVLATLCVLVPLGIWTWWYLSTAHRREVASTWFQCPYCGHKVKPGDWIVNGSRGWGHWGCSD